MILEKAVMCAWEKIAKEQRKHETERGLNKSGTRSFEKNGCYNCEDYTTCKQYVPIRYTIKNDNSNRY